VILDALEDVILDALVDKLRDVPTTIVFVLVDEVVAVFIVLLVVVLELEHPGAPPINLRFEKTNG
jgi:hypothetical protein